jgi:predicted nucleotidyltransferase component of viral defense system
MNSALNQMLNRYEPRTVEDRVRALREIMQELALLGLWRGKFFEKAAFYGGTALRILHGMDRFSEDLDFSLLKPTPDFDIARYTNALERELTSFGFKVTKTKQQKVKESPVQSAFLKADTLKQLLAIEMAGGFSSQIPRGQVIKIKLEVDTNPPPGFSTENRFLLQPIPFSVKAFSLPDLFAGKMHAVLCRRWKGRVKGRDWYDMVWFAAYHPELHLSHLRERMIQSGHLERKIKMDKKSFIDLVRSAIKELDVEQARKEVAPFVKNPEALEVWSREFFLDVVGRIVLI